MTTARTGEGPKDRTIVLSALCGLILLKAALLVAIGPLTSPDTGGYLAITDAMRSGLYWGALDLHDPAAAPLTARAPGYPALLALSEEIAGAGAYWVMAAVQAGLGLIAAMALYRFAFAVLDSRVPALLVAAAYATGLPLVLDQTLLTDGAYASLLVIFLCALGGMAVRRRDVPYGTVLLVGALPAAAFFLRESTVQVMAVMTPVVACFVYAVRPGILPRLAVLTILVLPLLIASAAMSAFNERRTGDAFVTSGLRSALLVPLVQMQARGAPVFDDDDPTVRALRAEIKEWRNEDIYAAVQRAEQRQGITPVAMSDAVRALFLRGIAAYPRTYAGVVLSELRPRYFALSVAPAASLGTLIASRGGALVSVSESIPTNAAGKFLTLGAYGATALVAAVCWVAMALGLPVLTLMRVRRGIRIDLAILLALTACHLGLMLLYAMVHIEARYLVAVQIVPTLALAYLVQAWRRRGGA